LEPADKLRRMLVVRVMERFDGIQAFVGSLDDFMARFRPETMQWRKQALQEEAQIFAEVLADGRDTGDFDVDDPKDTAHALLVATTALMPFDLSRTDLANRDDVAAMAERIAGLLVNGIAARA